MSGGARSGAGRKPVKIDLAAERGIPHDPEQHAAYVGSWIKTLKEDKNEIFRAAHDASRAADFLLAVERDRSLDDKALLAGGVLNSTVFAGSHLLIFERQNLKRGRGDQDAERTQVAEGVKLEFTDLDSASGRGLGQHLTEKVTIREAQQRTKHRGLVR